MGCEDALFARMKTNSTSKSCFPFPSFHVGSER